MMLVAEVTLDMSALNTFLISMSGLAVVVSHWLRSRQATQVASEAIKVAKNLKEENHTQTNQLKDQLNHVLENENGIMPQLATIQRWQNEHSELLKSRVPPEEHAKLMASVQLLLENQHKVLEKLNMQGKQESA